MEKSNTKSKVIFSSLSQIVRETTRPPIWTARCRYWYTEPAS